MESILAWPKVVCPCVTREISFDGGKTEKELSRGGRSSRVGRRAAAAEVQSNSGPLCARRFPTIQRRGSASPMDDDEIPVFRRGAKAKLSCAPSRAGSYATRLSIPPLSFHSSRKSRKLPPLSSPLPRPPAVGSINRRANVEESNPPDTDRERADLEYFRDFS